MFVATRLNTYMKLTLEGKMFESYSLESNLSYDDKEIFQFKVEENFDAVLGCQDNQRIETLNRRLTSGNMFEREISKWGLDAL